jgi:hypothetical protein
MPEYSASPQQEKLRPQNLIGDGGSVLVPGERTAIRKDMMEGLGGSALAGAIASIREPAMANGIGPRAESHVSSAYSADIQSQQANE